MMNPRSILALLLLLALVSCADLPGYKSDRENEKDSLADAFTYVERFESGRGSWEIPSGRHLPEVDFKSRIDVIPDRGKLARATGASGSVLADLPPEVQTRLDNLPQLIEDAHAYVESAEATLAEIEVARETAEELSSGRVRALRQKIAGQAETGLRLVETVLAVAEARARAEVGDADEESFVLRVGELTDPLFVDADGAEVTLNIDEFAKFLRREIQLANRVAREDAETAREAGTAKLRMRAYSKRNGAKVRVHVSPYDNIEEPNPVKERVSFRLTDEDQARLEREFEITRSAATLVRDLRDDRSDVRRVFRDLGASLKADIDALAVLDGTEILELVPAAVVGGLDRAIADPATRPEEKEELEALQRTLNEADALTNELRELIGGFDRIRADAEASSEANPARLLSTILALPDSLRDSVNKVRILLSSVRAILDGIRTLTAVYVRKLTETVALAADDPERLELQDVVSRMLPASTGKVGELLEVLERYDGVVLLLEEFSTRLKLARMADEFDPALLDEGVEEVEFDITKAEPGEINLANLDIDDGDALEIVTEVVTTENGEETVKSHPFTLAVTRFGVFSKLSAHLIFVNRDGNGQRADPAAGQEADPEVDFDPAPSVSWTLHVKARTEPSSCDDFLRFWNFVDPGLGVNVAAIDFEDENFQVGVGGHVSFFSDLFVGGYGYNLNADRDNGYFYLGIGLFEALNVIGTTTSRVLPRIGGSANAGE